MHCAYDEDSQDQLHVCNWLREWDESRDGLFCMMTAAIKYNSINVVRMLLNHVTFDQYIGRRKNSLMAIVNKFLDTACSNYTQYETDDTVLSILDHFET